MEKIIDVHYEQDEAGKLYQVIDVEQIPLLPVIALAMIAGSGVTMALLTIAKVLA